MIVLKLLEFCMSVILSFGNANACRASVSVAVLVVLVSGDMLAVEEFNVDCIGLGKGVVVVCVGCAVKL